MKRPEDISLLLPIVETLATYGVVRLEGEMDEWLKGIGVVAENSQNSLHIPTSHWLKHAVPAADPKELLRKTALCDPLYRQHLDLIIASILHMIAITERWGRFEDLLFGQLKQFSPRFMQLLAWLTLRFEKDAKLISESDWLSVANQELMQHRDLFSRWNVYLWGVAETPSALFPLLGDLYVPLLKVPVHFSYTSSSLDESQKRVLISLIQAAEHSEGITVDKEDKHSLLAILDTGVPVRVWAAGQQKLTAGIIGNVVITIPATEIRPARETTNLPVAITNLSTEIALSDADCHFQPAILWDLVGTSRSASVFYSLDLRLKDWPDQLPKDIFDNFAVPPLSVLRDAGKSRSVSPQVDTALQWLGDHPLYGFFLQLFLLEALDRELGEETLVFVPGMSHDNIESCDESATRVVYQPRTQGGGTMPDIRSPAYDLGILDKVVAQLAHSIGVGRIAHPYSLGKCGIWLKTLLLLRHAEIINDRYNRWSLTEHILDRLYGGGLMTSVIRRGKEMRELLHLGLKDQWDARERLQKKCEVHSE